MGDRGWERIREERIIENREDSIIKEKRGQDEDCTGVRKATYHTLLLSGWVPYVQVSTEASAVV